MAIHLPPWEVGRRSSLRGRKQVHLEADGTLALRQDTRCEEIAMSFANVGVLNADGDLAIAVGLPNGAYVWH